VSAAYTEQLERLAASLPGGPARVAVAGEPHGGWTAWGLDELTGAPDGPPAEPVVPVAARTAALLAAAEARVPGLDPARLFSRRAALHGWSRGGRTSVNGSCRLLETKDRWLAVNLARPADAEMVPALLEREFDGDPWAALTDAAAIRSAAPLAERAQMLGIPASVLGADARLRPLRWQMLGGPATTGTDVVLDLSAMWAGPLCAQLLSRAGAKVVKVEDVHRPDGARGGPAEFYADLHEGHASVVLDFSTKEGQAALQNLAAEADVLLESSRPRALRGLGLDVDAWLAARPGRTWISITGYGRDDAADRVAFGDDAAVAGGLVARAPDGTPVFCGDAIADPLTGLYAAVAALASREAGGGHLLDVAMAGVAAELARPS
jgi:hypothetical protein